MAIPNSPIFSELKDIKEYPTLTFEKPVGVGRVHAISLGPAELNNSQGKLNTRYWLVSQENGQVVIRNN